MCTVAVTQCYCCSIVYSVIAHMPDARPLRDLMYLDRLSVSQADFNNVNSGVWLCLFNYMCKGALAALMTNLPS